MKVEHLERIALNVPDVEEAVRAFRDLLGIEFEKKVQLRQPDGKEVSVAISSRGLELLEETPPLKEMSVRSFHFRVKDLGEAEKEVTGQGGVVLGKFSLGKVDEMICSFHNLRIVFLCYPGEDVIQAME